MISRPSRRNHLQGRPIYIRVNIFSEGCGNKIHKNMHSAGGSALRPHVYQGPPPSLHFRVGQHPHIYIFCRPLYNVAPLCIWFRLSHRTTLRADRTTTYTQHPQPLCDTNGKQPSGSRVNKGFPYMEDWTKPLCGQTKPLRIPNTHNHCVILMENKGPVLIRVFPIWNITLHNCTNIEYHIRVSPIWKITQNLFAGRLYQYIHLSPTSTV